jgi:hypothetical protein
MKIAVFWVVAPCSVVYTVLQPRRQQSSNVVTVPKVTIVSFHICSIYSPSHSNLAMYCAVCAVPKAPLNKRRINPLKHE